MAYHTHASIELNYYSRVFYWFLEGRYKSLKNGIKTAIDISQNEWKQRFISNIDKIDEKEDLLHDRYYIKENKTVVKLFKGYINEKDNTFKLLYIESRYGSFNHVLCFMEN